MSDAVDIYIGKRIRWRRFTLGMSREELGLRVGESAQSLDFYEQGLSSLTEMQLHALAIALSVSVDDFFPGANDGPSVKPTIGSPRLRFLVLGAAAGGGLPQWNCGCPNCQMARDPESGLRPQTQSSLAVSVNGEHWAILNASPDIRQQISDNVCLHPRTLRDTAISSVVLTNGDIDHIAGLLVLREKQAFSLFMTEALGDILDDNPIFRALDPDFVGRRHVALDTQFDLLPGLQATLFAVPGKVPLFMESGEIEIGAEGEQTIGVELCAAGLKAFYIPGCAFLPETLATRIMGADLVFFDGTLFTDDEMLVSGTGRKTGRRMGHMPISGEGGSLEALGALNVGRRVYIHINNTNPVWHGGPERDAVEAAGFEIAHDGMEIAFAARS